MIQHRFFWKDVRRDTYFAGASLKTHLCGFQRTCDWCRSTRLIIPPVGPHVAPTAVKPPLQEVAFEPDTRTPQNGAQMAWRVGA